MKTETSVESLPSDLASLQRMYDQLEEQGSKFLKGTNDLKRVLEEERKRKMVAREAERVALVQRKGRVAKAIRDIKDLAAAPKVEKPVEVSPAVEPAKVAVRK